MLHWYLPFVGVLSSQQRQGLGSALLAAVRKRCDADRMPASPEATSKRNRDLYLRHGFTVQHELDLPEGSRLWALWREPQPREAPATPPQ